MCYSGRCLFEDRMGSCQVCSLDFNEFKKKYGYPACQVGGSYEYDSPEDVEYYKNHEEEFKNIYRDYMKRFNWI